jgi:hypothetical protein
MPDRLELALSAAAISAFEQLAYCLAEPAPEPPPPGVPSDGVVSVYFRGPATGRLVLRVRGGVLPGIAASMLGRETPPAPAVQRDALGEMANVICGSVLPTVGGAAAVFNLDTPNHDEPWERHQQGAVPPAAVAHLVVDEGYADVVLMLDPPVVA